VIEVKEGLTTFHYTDVAMIIEFEIVQSGEVKTHELPSLCCQFKAAAII